MLQGVFFAFPSLSLEPTRDLPLEQLIELLRFDPLTAWSPPNGVAGDVRKVRKLVSEGREWDNSEELLNLLRSDTPR